MITETEIPSLSVLNRDGTAYHYTDSYQSSFRTNQRLDIADAGKLFFKCAPKQVELLFTLRNRIAGLLGLKIPRKISDRQKQIDNFQAEPGEQFGLFKVFKKTENELILGRDGKHLNFRVSLFLVHLLNEPEKKTLIVTTAVEYNNWFGRVYFALIRPFHRFIAAQMLKSITKEVEARN